MIDERARARFERQILLVGESGQEAIGSATARVLGEGPALEIAATYARAAGVAELVAAAGLDNGRLAPPDLVRHPAPGTVLAGARLALREIVRGLEGRGA